MKASTTRARLLLTVVIAAAGCNKVRTDRISIDPQESASRAITAYDHDGDRLLDAKELQASPSLAVAGERIDSDQDGRLSADEIAARLESYGQLSTHIAIEVLVTKSGRAVADAEVIFAPEPTLGESLPTYQGKSNSSGVVSLTTSPPTPGLAVGLYRVTIALPDGSTTERGYEVADDVPSVSRAQFAL